LCFGILPEKLGLKLHPSGDRPKLNTAVPLIALIFPIALLSTQLTNKKYLGHPFALFVVQLYQRPEKLIAAAHHDQQKAVGHSFDRPLNPSRII
jgi:hypothetical protein